MDAAGAIPPIAMGAILLALIEDDEEDDRLEEERKLEEVALVALQQKRRLLDPTVNLTKKKDHTLGIIGNGLV
jgi:hypothetical protein